MFVAIQSIATASSTTISKCAQTVNKPVTLECALAAGEFIIATPTAKLRIGTLTKQNAQDLLVFAWLRPTGLVKGRVQ